MNLLELHNLLVRRNGFTLELPEFAIREGETLALVGPNGAGKSTLLLTLARLLRPARGEMRFRNEMLNGRDATAYRRRLALVMQEPILCQGTVESNVATGLKFRCLPKAEIARRTAEWLERLGIAPLRHRPVRELSGGEAQRVSIARAFAIEPELLLLDEPMTGLDEPTRQTLMRDLQQIVHEQRAARKSQTFVFVTHRLDEAMKLADRTGVLLQGRLRQILARDHGDFMALDKEVRQFLSSFGKEGM